MKIKFDKTGMNLKVSETMTEKITYGSFAVLAGEIAFVAKGFKKSGIKGLLKNAAIMCGAEIAAYVPYVYLAVNDKTDNPYYKAYNKAADIVGVKVYIDEQ